MTADASPLQLDVRGLRLAARAWGPEDGPRVLAGHGWLDNAATWDRLAPLLGGLRIVAIDFPGHGLSAHRPQASPYHFLDLIAELGACADALGWDRFSLLGHSMGAGVASLLAGTFPERIDRMVLVEGLGPMVELPQKAAERMAMAIEAEKKRSGKKKRVFADLDEAAEKIAAVTQMRPDSARILLERGMRPVDGGLTWRADSRLRLPSRVRFSEAQVTSFLTRITCPTLLVRARDGFDFDAEVMRARAAEIADLELVELDGHHHLHLDDPQAVAAVIVPFLQPLLDAAR